nr:reverse transcriptase domain-containing protein [Tanacetum cinerariifolium]
MAGQVPPQCPIPDLRSMEELLQAPTDGVGDAIVVPPILANQFELKDSLNSTANGNFLRNNTQEALTIIENKSKFETSRNKPQVSSASGSSTQDAHVIALTKQVEAFLSFINRPVSSIQNGCETCGGPHPYYECQAAGGYTQDDRSEKEPDTLMHEEHITSPIRTAHAPPLGVKPVSPLKPKEDSKPNPHQPKILYPSSLNKTKLLDKNDVQVSKFLKILKQLHFDISLMDILTQILKFTKVLKDLLKDKEKLEELANTPMNAKCFAILLNKVPVKLGDPKKFVIPCVLQDLEPTRMTLELANQSVTFPMGIAKDVIVNVVNFNFLADFVIIDFEADPRVPIILGRPFLRTARAHVDLYEEKLTLRVRNEEVVFCTNRSSRNNLRDIHSIHCINIIDFFEDKMISGNPTPSFDFVVDSSSPSPIPYGDSDSLVEETNILLSYIDDSFLEYETFCFDMEEKSSGSTTTHFDYSLSDYDAFYLDDDHIEEKSNGSTTTHSDFSLPEYDSFIFDLWIDPFPRVDRSVFYHEEFADKFAHIISPPNLNPFVDIPSGESKVPIEVLSVLWRNRLPIQMSADEALPRRLTWDPPADVAADVAWVHMPHGTTQVVIGGSLMIDCRSGVQILRESYIPSATSAADVAATCANGTQSADVALPCRLTWGPPANVAVSVAWVHMPRGTTQVVTRGSLMIDCRSKKLLSRKSRSEPSLLFDIEENDMAGQVPPQGPIPDLCSMEELLQAPTDGVGDAIVESPILANQFELKISLLNVVIAIAFHGFENDDHHSHVRRFTKITQTVKLNNVSSDVFKMLLFPFSLEGAARTWLEIEPPNSITTWNDLVSKFVNCFFSPSKTTNLRNEITRFQQRFSETFSEACDRFKDLLNKCPYHGFSPLHQIDTFYNSLN